MLGLSRWQQAAVLCVGTLVVWLHCAWPTRLMSAFVGLATVRCNLRQAEARHTHGFWGVNCPG